MMAITAQQLADIRADIGDEAEAVWTDDEISRIWERMSGAPNDVVRLEATLAQMIRQLLANASMLRDYTAGATGEKMSQVMSNLQKLYALYEPSLKVVLGTGLESARGFTRGVPRQGRRYPSNYRRERREGGGNDAL